MKIEKGLFYISVYSSSDKYEVEKFIIKVLGENNRDYDDKYRDILEINSAYMKDGCFWCAKNQFDEIIGTIGVRRIDDYYEIRRFFVNKDNYNNGIGKKLLERAIDFLIAENIFTVKIATMEDGKAVQHLIRKFKFEPTKRYNKSTADLFFKLNLSFDYIYEYKLKQIKSNFNNTLIMNPTENIPMYNHNTDIFESMYVSSYIKDSSAKIIFSGRDEHIKFFSSIKKHWADILEAEEVDLTTLSGLNAHLVLFLCLLEFNTTVLLLPESAGGHFSTSKILERIGINVVYMEVDNTNYMVDVDKTREVIKREKPEILFVDRSEGLYYEDFSWVQQFPGIYKIFDASQYFTDIIIKKYQTPFEMGFDMIVSTLHKNYPGPQKGIFSVKDASHKNWKVFKDNVKTFISSTHPRNVVNSIQPFLQYDKLKEYADITANVTIMFEQAMINNNIPIVKRKEEYERTLHIWLVVPNQKTFDLYQKLEEVGLLVNYRLLPYGLGHGLRIGFSAAVRSGLREKHMNKLCEIFVQVYNSDINLELKLEVKDFIKSVKVEPTAIL